jgi:hypothetical protein
LLHLVLDSIKFMLSIAKSIHLQFIRSGVGSEVFPTLMLLAFFVSYPFTVVHYCMLSSTNPKTIGLAGDLPLKAQAEVTNAERVGRVGVSLILAAAVYTTVSIHILSLSSRF